MLDELSHSGVKRRSGRYDWGSGDIPYQHESWFKWGMALDKCLDAGMTEKQASESLGISIADYRARKGIWSDINRAANVTRALKLRDSGHSIEGIAEIMHVPVSTARTWLDPTVKERALVTTNCAKALKESVDKQKYVDIGPGTEAALGISRTTFKKVLTILKDEGYETHSVFFKQLGTGGNKNLTVSTMVAPGVTYEELLAHKSEIGNLGVYSDDHGKTIEKIEPYASVSPDRVRVRYAEEGGKDKDGMIEIRRGVPDLSLGSSAYAQVRIAVNGTHYLKGMATYSDDLPPGVDIMFNTNKHKGTPMLDTETPKGDRGVLKPLKAELDKTDDSPFGATVHQQHYIDENGNKKLSPLNICRDEGEWSQWSKSLASQFLSKQNPSLISKQMQVTLAVKRGEVDDLKHINNPLVKANQLIKYADGLDQQAVDMSTMMLPRSAWKVFLPVPSLKKDECYCPQYPDGTIVSVVRFPHAGPFEIPVLRVNNKNKEAIARMGSRPIDAIGLGPDSLAQLSGADTDGDTGIVIPNPGGKMLTTMKQLKSLENFDPQEYYPERKGMKYLSGSAKQKEMGMITNLITDLGVAGADYETEISRAVKHSMCVIDAEKHRLDYQRSYEDNNIQELVNKYRNGNKGAATILSRNKSPVFVPQRDPYHPYDIDPDTGEKVFRYTGEMKTVYKTKIVEENGKKKKVKVLDESGNPIILKQVPKQTRSTKMFETEDATTLIGNSSSVVEHMYANYANELKRMANEARKEAVHAGKQTYDPEAFKAYHNEVKSLDTKIYQAESGKPLERKAQAIANSIMKAKLSELDDSGNMSYADRKQLEGRTLQQVRMSLGSSKYRIDITPKEWDAIQAGAVTTNKLSKILRYADEGQIEQYTMPKTNGISDGKLAAVKAMLAANTGYTQADIAEHFGISVSSVNRIALDMKGR